MGQKDWKGHGATENAFVVMPEIVRAIYYESQRQGLFSKLNLGRSVKTTKIIHNGNAITIDAGNDSPVWEKQLNENSEARFTLREENLGMATYGDGDVGTGDFARYLHLVCYARSVFTPAWPIVGFESADNIKRVVNDLVAVEKESIATWISKEMDFDAFRALFMGASRGLLDTANGGKGVSLYGATTGQHRSIFNAYAQTANGLAKITPDIDATTHNGNIAASLSGSGASALPTTVADNTTMFKYRTHKDISAIVDDLQLQSVRVGGREYRAVAIIDPRNIYSLRDDNDIVQMWAKAMPRAEDNLALYSRDTLILDDILYIPAYQMKYFRPTVSGSTITYGVGMDKDPRTNPANTSNITMTAVLGRGALIRGRRKGEIKFTTDSGRHGKGAEYAANYDDGWMRREWGSQDDRTTKRMLNDSSFIVFNRDNPRIGT